MNVIELAKEAGMLSINDRGLYGDFVNFERFAALVRAEALADHSGDATEMVAEPVKQEPVAWWCCVPGQDAILLFDEPSDERYPPKYKSPLYAAPVDAKAIRAEALEEAIAKCAPYGLTGECVAIAIRGLK